MIFTIGIYLSVFLSALYQGISLFRKKPFPVRITGVINLIIAALLLILLIIRSLQIRFIALTSTYESLLFYALGILVLTGWYGWQKKFRPYGIIPFFATLTVLGLLLVASSPLVSPELKPPVPALQSGWLILHVVLSFVGESFFVFSFITALLYLISRDQEKKINYDRLTYAAVSVGFPVFTLGALVFGAVWAEAAWGAFWSWDPKETWALITWLVYALYLHFRIYRKQRKTASAWFALIGFLSTLFTFFGVNYLLGGLHSYG